MYIYTWFWTIQMRYMVLDDRDLGRYCASYNVCALLETQEHLFVAHRSGWDRIQAEAMHTRDKAVGTTHLGIER